MERTCMAGYGRLSLKTASKGREFSCVADIDDPPTDRGRVRGLLQCTDGRKLLFSLRNTGPDQGVGVAREQEAGDLMLFFYHASKDEAERRFPSVKADFTQAMAAGRR